MLRKEIADIYPSYNCLIQAKKICYPSSTITVSDISAKIDLQSLAGHTSNKLLEYLGNSLNNKIFLEHLIFIFKWGCDGSSGYSQYRK